MPRGINQFSAAGQFIRFSGQDAVSVGPDDSSVDEQQKVTVKASGGNFTLGFPPGVFPNTPQITPQIAYNAPPSVVEDALNALTTIAGARNSGIVSPGAGGSVTVTGGPSGPGDPGPWNYIVTFHGYLGGDDVSQLIPADGGLQGVGHAATVSTVVEGGAYESCTTSDACLSGGSGYDIAARPKRPTQRRRRAPRGQ